MPQSDQPETILDEFIFCHVVFWRNPARWIMRDPRAYWFWLVVYIAPTIILIEEFVRRG